MKVWVKVERGQDCPSVELTMKIRERDLSVALSKGREVFREQVRWAARKMFNLGGGDPVGVAFEDECKLCGTIKEEGHRGEFDTMCPNPACRNGFPTTVELHQLMSAIPVRTNGNGKDESASAYLARIKHEWKKRHGIHGNPVLEEEELP